jgi:hypothetical protein
MEGRVERLISMSRAVLDRLERGDRLSAVLPQARAAVELYGNRAHVHWLDCEIYGMPHVPFAKRPRETQDEKAGGYLFCELRKAEDVRKLSVDRVLREWPKDEIPDRGMVIHQSVGHLERTVEEYREPSPGETWAPSADHILQLGALHRENQRILDGVRAYVYQYIDKIWSWAVQERNNVKLLGPDYRMVVDSLEALETGVGQELLAALSHLGSTNPAEWALSALACRNVVLSLGRTLFPLRTGVHHCAMLGKDLELKGEKELNWLTAFIDFHWQTAADEDKGELHGLGELARGIYQTGSRGKNKAALGHTQVQELVARTFRLVSGLKEITGLEPLDAAAVTGG